jgi:hypothetical protein
MERHQDRLEHVTHTSKQVYTYQTNTKHRGRNSLFFPSFSFFFLALVFRHTSTARAKTGISIYWLLHDSSDAYEDKSIYIGPWLIHRVVWARTLSSNASEHNISCINNKGSRKYISLNILFRVKTRLLCNLWQFSFRGFRTDERLPEKKNPFGKYPFLFSPSTEYRSTML